MGRSHLLWFDSTHQHCSLGGPERVANVLRLGHGYAFPMHEAGSTPALGFQGDYFIHH